jgi:hypothetical protein
MPVCALQEMRTGGPLESTVDGETECFMVLQDMGATLCKSSLMRRYATRLAFFEIDGN